MKFNVINLGCKVNAYESESIAELMEKRGHKRVSNEETSDATIIFTCAVTNTAAQKSRQMIHRAQRKNPNTIIAVAGCYVQVDPDAVSDVDVLVGTAEKTRIPDYIETFAQTHKQIRSIQDDEHLDFENMSMSAFENQTRAYLKIQDGCNQFCAYCVIPYARGRERSMNPDQVILEAKKLSEHHREIVLTGIHTGRYGREYGVSLTEVMKRILSEVPGVERLRISSIEITEVTGELIELMKTDQRIARHLHIPLQAGCDHILDLMHRPYHTDAYYAKIQWIREQIPDISISCDLIVGFPQESDEDHAMTMDFLKKCEFSFLHVFPFSLRKGTEAEKLSGHVHPSIKKARAAECIALSESQYDAFKATRIGTTVEVLIEKSEGGYSFGHSSEYLPVYIVGDLNKGEIFTVDLEYLEDHKLYGKRHES